jgi:hypothetical protein
MNVPKKKKDEQPDNKHEQELNQISKEAHHHKYLSH